MKTNVFPGYRLIKLERLTMTFCTGKHNTYKNIVCIYKTNNKTTFTVVMKDL